MNATDTGKDPSDGGGGKPFSLSFTLPLMLGTTLNPINSSMIAIGLAGFGAHFRVTPGTAAMLVSVLYLCSAVAQPTFGKLAMVFGPRRVLIAGLMIVPIGGILGGLAPRFWMLLIARALIGIGTSACYPAAMALVRRRADRLGLTVPSRVLGDFSIAAQVTVVLGLPLGGVLTALAGWRGLFWVNVPLALVALLGVVRSVERDELRPRAGLESSLPMLDLPGIGLFASATTALLVFLRDLTPPALGTLALSALLLTGLVAWERRSAAPLIDVRMLARNGVLLRTYLRQFIVALAIYTALYAMSQWMEASAGYAVARIALMLLPMSLVSIVCARLTSNLGWVRWPLCAGGAAVAAVGLIMGAATGQSSPFVLVGMAALLGMGNGLSNVANQTTLYAGAPADGVGVAAGLFRTFGSVGAIFSASLIGLTLGPSPSDAGLHRLAVIVLLIGAIAATAAILDPTLPVRARGVQGPGQRL